VGTRIHLSIRPENLLPGDADAAAIPATVNVNVPLGPIDVTELRSACGVPIKMARPHRTEFKALPPGAQVHLRIESLSSCSVFAESGDPLQ
jgi:putative spermidine/putrescine transport system ATP-binding protein